MSFGRGFFDDFEPSGHFENLIDGPFSSTRSSGFVPGMFDKQMEDFKNRSLPRSPLSNDSHSQMVGIQII